MNTLTPLTAYNIHVERTWSRGQVRRFHSKSLVARSRSAAVIRCVACVVVVVFVVVDVVIMVVVVVVGNFDRSEAHGWVNAHHRHHHHYHANKLTTTAN